MSAQLQFDLGMDISQKHEIDIELIQKQINDIRKSFFARMHGIEQIIEDNRLENERLKAEIERLKLMI